MGMVLTPMGGVGSWLAPDEDLGRVEEEARLELMLRAVAGLLLGVGLTDNGSGT